MNSTLTSAPAHIPNTYIFAQIDTAYPIASKSIPLFIDSYKNIEEQSFQKILPSNSLVKFNLLSNIYC